MMKIGVFAAIIVTTVFVLSIVNSFWIGRLFRQTLRKKVRLIYGGLTLLSAASYLGIRATTVQLDGWSIFSIVYYFGPFWTVLQLLLLLAWPFSQLAGWLQQRWSRPGDTDSASSAPNRKLDPSMTRRSFLSSAAILPPLAMTGINTIGVLDAEFRAVLRRIEIGYDGLPSGLNGLKMAHMTDVHLGPYISSHDVNKLSALLLKESPDLLAITGDFVDDVAKLPAALDTMRPLLASLPLGAWFCMGNHEHMRGVEPIRKVLQDYGISILDNRHQTIHFGGARFVLAGVDYPVGSSPAVRPEMVRQFMETASSDISRSDFTVLMAHHPDFLPVAFERQIDLTLAGHTHGGQVGWGQRSALQFMYPYMRGVYRQKQSVGFVSSGAGHWLPFRLNCPPEVSLITLKRNA